MMDNWQFFLQKEGDYAWLPLETPQVEILEGRYQLIAHTSNPGQSVRVNIRHQYEQEDILQENIQESLRQAEITGTVEILPLVYLGLGSWSISCYPLLDAGTDPCDQKEQSYSLDIQVLSQDFDLFEDWNFGDLEVALEETADIESPPIMNLELASVSSACPSFQQSMDDGLMELPIASDEVASDEVASDEKGGMAESRSAELTSQRLQVQEPEGVSSGQTDFDMVAQVDESISLPRLPQQSAPVFFRTVKPTELPVLVIDQAVMVMDSAQSPELPSFMQPNLENKAQQRSRSLTKLKFIAAAVSQQGTTPDLKPGTLQQRFHTKLNRIAVGAGR